MLHRKLPACFALLVLAVPFSRDAAFQEGAQSRRDGGHLPTLTFAVFLDPLGARRERLSGTERAYTNHVYLNAFVPDRSLLDGADQMIKGSNKSSKTASMPLDRSLNEIGRKYDTYFTIEEAWADDGSINPMRAALVQPLPKAESLVQELEYLKKAVANLTYSPDQANSRIIHIIDSRLLSQKDYALERVIPRIDYNGPAYDLADAIAKLGILISCRRFGSLPHLEAWDYVSVVHVKGESLKVRGALSDFLPLDRQGNILWVATTKIGPCETSYVAIHGSPRQRPRRCLSPSELIEKPESL